MSIATKFLAKNENSFHLEIDDHIGIRSVIW